MSHKEITAKDVYELVDRKFGELETKFNDRVSGIETQVDSNTNWRNQLTGKITVLVAVVGIAVNWGWDSIVNRG